MEKRYPIYLDIRQSITYTSIEFVQGDNLVNVLDIYLTDGSEPFDLTNKAIIITFKRPDDTFISRNVQIMDAENGHLCCLLGYQEVYVPGNVMATVKVFNEQGAKLTTPKFQFVVRKQLYPVEELEVKTNYSVLGSALIAADNEKERVQAERERINSEDVRINSENARMDAEVQRATAENIRQNNENTRNNQELSRQSNENNRILAEAERNNKEAIRVSNENHRKNAENLRMAAEEDRANAENIRMANEHCRKFNEIERQATILQFKNWYNNSSLTGRLPFMIDGGDFGDNVEGSLYDGGDF